MERPLPVASWRRRWAKRRVEEKAGRLVRGCSRSQGSDATSTRRRAAERGVGGGKAFRAGVLGPARRRDVNEAVGARSIALDGEAQMQGRGDEQAVGDIGVRARGLRFMEAFGLVLVTL